MSRSPQNSPKRSRSPSPRRSNSRSPSRSASPRARSRSPVREQENTGNVLFVDGLSTRTRTEDLEQTFEKYGKISGVKLVTDPRTDECRGFGFVTFEDYKDANDCIDANDKLEVSGRPVTIEKARLQGARKSTPGRYLGNDRYKRGFNRGYGGGGYGGGGYRDRGYGGGDYDRGYGGGYDRGYGGGGYRDRGYGGGYDRRSRSPPYRDSRGYGGYDRRSRSPY